MEDHSVSESRSNHLSFMTGIMGDAGLFYPIMLKGILPFSFGCLYFFFFGDTCWEKRTDRSILSKSFGTGMVLFRYPPLSRVDTTRGLLPVFIVTLLVFLAMSYRYALRKSNSNLSEMPYLRVLYLNTNSSTYFCMCFLLMW